MVDIVDQSSSALQEFQNRRQHEAEQAALRDYKLATGFKYPLPDLPLPPGSKLQDRYSDIITQFTNLLMRNGKKGKAERVCRDSVYSN